MRKICLSVLIPMYNVEKYIGECLDSILSNKVQDFEYEVIVADDGSSDGSLSVAKDFEARYDNVKVFSFANRGASLTRKFLLNEAKGDFVWFVDADDYVDEKLVEKGFITLKIPVEGGSLSGLSFCFTGELSMKRSQAEQLVKEHGGTTKSSVVKGLSYLVTNDTASGSSKNKKAAQLGIPVIDETAFMKLLEV